jgi:UDP-glucose 4-epimerase
LCVGASDTNAMTSSLRILITGGAGYIGSHMVKFALANGHHVRAFDNLSTGFPDALPEGVLVQGDLLDPASLRRALRAENYDGVIHFAGAIQVGESMKLPLKYHAQNTTGTLNLIEACIAAGVKHLVYSSSAAVYGQPDVDVIDEMCPLSPINPYGRTKMYGETMLADCDRAHGLTSASLRYFNAAGADPDGELGERHNPETHLIPLLLQTASGRRTTFTINGDDFATPDGTCVRDYVHVSDLCAAHLLALEYLLGGGKTTAINLGSGSGFSVREVLDAVRRITGRDFALTIGPRREGDPARLVASRAKAEKVLGWRCEYSQLDTIIRHAWAWERKQAGLT